MSSVNYVGIIMAENLRFLGEGSSAQGKPGGRLKELKVQKGELEQEQMRLTVAIEKDEVGQQIHEIEKLKNYK